jgi:hypothetical protein
VAERIKNLKRPYFFFVVFGKGSARSPCRAENWIKRWELRREHLRYAMPRDRKEEGDGDRNKIMRLRGGTRFTNFTNCASHARRTRRRTRTQSNRSLWEAAARARERQEEERRAAHERNGAHARKPKRSLGQSKDAPPKLSGSDCERNLSHLAWPRERSR